VYSNPQSLEKPLGDFCFKGYRRGMKLIFISNRITRSDFKKALSLYGLDLEEMCRSGQLIVSDKEESYLKGGLFKPENMLRMLEDTTLEAVNSGFNGLCVGGDMSWILDTSLDMNGLLEYESEVNVLMKKLPFSAACIYDISAMDGKSLLQVSRLHPFTLEPEGPVPNFDYFEKPLPLEDCTSEECIRIFRGVSVMLSELLRLRGLYTENHSESVSRLARSIAEQFGRGEELSFNLEAAGRVHDIGMLSLYSDMIVKPGKLTWYECKILHEHPVLGYELVKKVPFPRKVARAVLEHHERLDGSGYPLGLRGSQISLEGRILAVAEVVAAMSHYRTYRVEHGTRMALKEISDNSGKLYDSDVVSACYRSFERGFTF
jgi:HD-GYP domain-containing protein (c-di-GMP phosphodiesterase class II)